MADEDEAVAVEEEKIPEIKLDKKAEAQFCTFYRGLKTVENTLRFFDRQQYYSVHGEDAHFIARHFYKTQSVIKHWGGNAAEVSKGSAKSSAVAGTGSLPYVSISPALYQSIVKELLLNQQKSVEVWSQKGSSWQVAKKASPGDVHTFEELLCKNGDLEDNPILAAINITDKGDHMVVGLAWLSTIEQTLGFCEFNDTAPNFPTLESALVNLGAKECLCGCGLHDAEVQKLCRKCNIMVTERAKTEFSSRKDFTANDLKRLLRNSTYDFEDKTSNQCVFGALTCLVRSAELMSDEENIGHYQLVSQNFAGMMKIDSSAVMALNLLPSATDVSKSMSVYGLLNRCRTPMGSRLLLNWIKQPLLDRAKIDARLDIVQIFELNPTLRGSMTEAYIRKAPDLNRLSRKFQKRKGNLEDCIKLYEFVVHVLPTLWRELSSYDGDGMELIRERFADPLKNADNDFQQFVAMVENSIDLEAATHHEYLISAKWDPELKRLKQIKDELNETIQSSNEDVARDLGCDSKKIKVEHNASHSFYWRVVRKDEQLLRNRPAYISIDTKKDGVRFYNKRLKQLAQEYEDASSQYEHLQQTLVARAMEIVATYTPVIDSLSEKVAELDVLVSFAHLATSAAGVYVRPTVLDSSAGKMELIASRHPLLEALDDVGNASSGFIANDVSMERGKSNFLIITGPNMGGKSTYIRQVGVIVLMAQIGCYVPCDKATISICDSILARVGAGDSQLRGVSTFMSEMLETASILQTSTENSLLIIDELGRGTSTSDGMGLAWAISEYIVTQLKSYCLFATHFHELTQLEMTLPGVRNLHVTAQTSDNSLVMLYKVQPGFIEQSFGIHVAELVGMPEPVIQLAKRKAAELESFDSPDSGSKPKRNKNDAMSQFVQQITELDTSSETEVRKVLQDLRSMVEVN